MLTAKSPALNEHSTEFPDEHESTFEVIDRKRQTLQKSQTSNFKLSGSSRVTSQRSYGRPSIAPCMSLIWREFGRIMEKSGEKRSSDLQGAIIGVCDSFKTVFARSSIKTPKRRGIEKFNKRCRAQVVA